jgi:hypothetical protein
MPEQSKTKIPGYLGFPVSELLLYSLPEYHQVPDQEMLILMEFLGEG